MLHRAMLALLFALLSTTNTYANDEKCLALANLAETIYRNKASVNELQILKRMELKANSIDFAFIKLFSGLAYSGQKLTPSKFQEGSYRFCSQLVDAIQKHSGAANPSKFCEPAVNFTNVINTFRTRGDSKDRIKKAISENFSSSDSATRAVSDYLELMVEMRFSPLFENQSDKEFMDFSSRACSSFSVYLKQL